MSEVLCSTGALIGRPNGRDYHLLREFVPKLECDGLEFMVYSTWYPEIRELCQWLAGQHYHIPVLHCEKSLGEYLTGLSACLNEKGRVISTVLTKEEDEACYREGLEHFHKNLSVANAVGANRMVLHLWNGLPSDRNLEKNIERFATLREIAKNEGVSLLVENVICNQESPLRNLRRVRDAYPDVSVVFDTKMARFHREEETAFTPEWEWLWTEGHVQHLHINDYAGEYLDWSNLKVLPIGEGEIDFVSFFDRIRRFHYSGDYTVESTGFRPDGSVDFEMLNRCFRKIREMA